LYRNTYNRARVRKEELVIAPLIAADIRPAAVLLGNAMSTNPMHLEVFGNDGEASRRRQTELFAVFLREFPGERLVARQAGEIVGVLRMVRSPLCRLPPGEVERLGPIVGLILGDAAARVGRWFEIWAEHDPPTTHWHLGPIAVAHERQGHGIGSAMLRHFCEHVDARGEPAHLETDRAENVCLYERFGFRIGDEVELFGVKNYFMWRPACPGGETS
jgi:ribosomal protein S18 acetylase RimI-like enzyme